MERLYLPEVKAPGKVRLPRHAAHYLVRVLRLKKGQDFLVFDGISDEWRATLDDISRHEAEATILERVRQEDAPRVTVEVLPALVKGERMDWAIQKCTELGVSAIRPVATERTVARIDAQKATRLERWHTLAAEACRQCGRIRLPEITPPASLVEALNDEREGLNLMLHFGPEAKPLAALHREHPDVHLVRAFSGPEGGFTEAEMLHMQRNNTRLASLGPRVLRAETAPVAAATLIQGLWGDMA